MTSPTSSSYTSIWLSVLQRSTNVTTQKEVKIDSNNNQCTTTSCIHIPPISQSIPITILFITFWNHTNLDKSIQQHLNVSYAQPLYNAMQHWLNSCMWYWLNKCFFIWIGSPLWTSSPHSELLTPTLSLGQVTSPISELMTHLFHNKDNIWCMACNNAKTITQ